MSKISDAFLRCCKIHAVLTLCIGFAIYTQCYKEAIVFFGVSSESAHSLRNTGFFLCFASFVSFSVMSRIMREFFVYMGRGLVGEQDDPTLTFSAGFAAILNFFLLTHYTAEAFLYDSVSKTAVVIVWILSIGAILGIKIMLISDHPTSSTLARKKE
jgi:hypothetical protein